jgi:hypothetical protein
VTRLRFRPQAASAGGRRTWPHSPVAAARLRSAGHRVYSLTALLALVAIFGGCTTRLTPPPSPANPVPVLILDHGRHASLVLPSAQGGTIRYSYGDWRYYARDVTGLRSGAAALFWPTASALGRRELEAPPEEAAVRRALRVWADTVITFQVEGARAEALRTRLDTLYSQGREKAHLYNETYDLDFVHHPRRYWFGHNSNQVLAGWLRELGINARGPTLLSSWKVEPPHGAGAEGGQRRPDAPNGRPRPQAGLLPQGS